MRRPISKKSTPWRIGRNSPITPRRMKPQPKNSSAIFLALVCTDQAEKEGCRSKATSGETCEFMVLFHRFLNPQFVEHSGAFPLKTAIFTYSGADDRT